MRSDSYLGDLGLEKLGFLNTIKVYLKIAIVLPLLMFWKILKFLFNPKKSTILILKKALILPFLEFATGKKTTEKVLKDYTYFHESILKKEVFENENLKVNFEAHKDILLNSKIASFFSILFLALIYVLAFFAIDFINATLIAITLVTMGFGAFIAIPLVILSYIAKVFLSIAFFAIEFNLLRSLFVFEKREIEEYLDETIVYADLKNREIFGDEHADKVKSAFYDAYLMNKEEIYLVDLKEIDKFMKIENKNIEVKVLENENSNS